MRKQGIHVEALEENKAKPEEPKSEDIRDKIFASKSFKLHQSKSEPI